MGLPSAHLGRISLIHLDEEELPTDRLSSSQPSSPKRPKIHFHHTTKAGSFTDTGLPQITKPPTTPTTRETATDPTATAVTDPTVAALTSQPQNHQPLNHQTPTREKPAHPRTGAAAHPISAVTDLPKAAALVSNHSSDVHAAPQDVPNTCQRVAAQARSSSTTTNTNPHSTT